MRASVLRLGLATAGVTALVAGAVVVGGPAQASGSSSGSSSGKGSGAATVAQPVPADATVVYVGAAGGGTGHGKGTAKGHAKGATSVTVKDAHGNDVVIGCAVVTIDGSSGSGSAPYAVPAPGTRKLGKLQHSGKAVVGKAVADTGAGGATGAAEAASAIPVAVDGSVAPEDAVEVQIPEGLDCSAA